MHAYAPYVHTYMYEPYVHTYMYEIVYIHMTHVTRINFVHVCVYIYIIMILCYVFFHLCTCQARPNSPVLADPEVKDQRESKLPKKPIFNHG